ncbi:MAG: alpha/beta hydrolase, partial [Gemmataceae bacterium]
ALLVPLAEPPKPQRVLLWPEGAPGAVGKTPADQPVVTIYRPAFDRQIPTAILVVPGGGYGGLALSHEGKEIAEWLTARGITAFVLEYRLGPRYRHPTPLLDAQRGLRLIRSQAKDLGIDPNRIGIWGFSAGGHLTSTVCTKFDAGKPDSTDPIDRLSSRPDFAILCYPVIRLDPPHAHMGSRRNLLGDRPDEKLVQSLCNDTQVTKDTPPTFIFHTRADKAVPVQNGELYHAALVKAGVPARLVIYDGGPHGVGLGKRHPEVKDWPNKLETWLKERKLLTGASPAP